MSNRNYGNHASPADSMNARMAKQIIFLTSELDKAQVRKKEIEFKNNHDIQIFTQIKKNNDLLISEVTKLRQEKLELGNFNQDVNNLRKEIEVKNAKINNLTRQLHLMQAEKENTCSKLFDTEQKYENHSGKINKLEIENSHLKTENDRQKLELETLEANNRELIADNKLKITQLGILETKLKNASDLDERNSLNKNNEMLKKYYELENKCKLTIEKQSDQLIRDAYNTIMNQTNILESTIESLRKYHAEKLNLEIEHQSKMYLEMAKKNGQVDLLMNMVKKSKINLDESNERSSMDNS